MSKIKYGSVCSGIEAATVAWHPLGFEAAWFSEIESFTSAVLAHHYPLVPNLGDMTGIAARVLSGQAEAPDILVGGTPCQAFSIAGDRGGLGDERGALTLSYVELANAIDRKRAERGEEPCVIVWENVPGVLSSKDNAFGCFLGAIAGEDCALEPPGGGWTNAGCVFGPQRAIAWRILDAQYFGVAQRRRRVFVIASARKGFDPTKVLFEYEGVRRDSAPSRESWKDTTGSTGDGIARCPTTGEMKRQDWETCNFVASFHEDQQTTRHVYPDPVRAVSLRGREGGATAELGDNIQNCLRASSGGGDKPYVLAPIHGAAQSFYENQQAEVYLSDTTSAISCGGGKPGQGYAAVLTGMAVRRLTLTECERLQGFQDGHTDIIYKGKPAADGPRYKALGNSMAVPCMAFLGKRIAGSL